MKSVKEVSNLTGISVRTLHYYDEIGLLKPASWSEAGYRLYDDKALETLQQILFFREFDMPLKEIKVILENPDFDKNTILRSQKKMLELKKDRLVRLIDSIDGILKGENKMNFELFSRNEIEDLYESMIGNMSGERLQAFEKQYGTLEAFKEHFMENAGSLKAQQNFKKVMEWYGDKNEMLDAVKCPNNSEIMQAYQNRISAIYQKLANKMGCDVTLFEVKEIVGEYDFIAKQLYQMKDVSKLLLELADRFENDSVMCSAMDNRYGQGAAAYIGKAVREFYSK
ncbi:MerR family transcriptional regulator [Clostridium sp. MCC353]|uniref:MerR family transcriptional regulator n=1 Tax=Clostridium sp. MCC353 TaxID=2592646 RepID=UPI001C00C1B0|nr:MerR family transcriptional regulator [Clostridium sp. MCC353]MBT9776645.1 MerR family transcriptional regulator [Clostridium sp. MCC353]